MKITYKIVYGFLLLIFTLAGIGCKKFVSVDPPLSQLVTVNVFNSDPSATSALLNVYAQMYKNSDSYYLEAQTGLLSDELTNPLNTQSYAPYYTNSMQAISNSGCWSDAYNCIYQANAIIEALQGNNAVSASANKQIMGEAKFIRAFWHFYLANSYGDVPLITSTDYRTNSLVERTPIEKVFQQIISDLLDAKELLNSEFVDASDTTASNPTDRIRPTKWAAMSLLARAYLYRKDYQNAEINATSVINQNSIFSLVNNLDSVFLANSNEAIWQLGVPSNNLYNTPEGYFFYSLGTPPYGISDQLLTAFENNDNRKIHWLNLYTGSGTSYYYPFKYKVNNVKEVTEYVMMLRLAEQYLIRAEARANGAGAGLTGAILDLDTLRRRAGLVDYSGALNRDSVLAAIMHERQVELFTEWGHRWFDLIRNKEVDEVMSIVTPLKGGTWNSYCQLFPIPESDISKDPHLTQNDGY